METDGDKLPLAPPSNASAESESTKDQPGNGVTAAEQIRPAQVRVASVNYGGTSSTTVSEASGSFHSPKGWKTQRRADEMPSSVALRLQATSIRWTRYPQQVTCPMCGALTVTDTTKVRGTSFWCLFGICLSISIVIFPLLLCIWLPFCCLRLYEVEHRCGDCHQVIGRRKA